MKNTLLEPSESPCKNSKSWKGGRCKKIVENGDYYYVVYFPNHPSLLGKKSKYIREHRWIMEQHLNRFLEPEEIVHHKNGNKHDNRIENLELTTKSEHNRIHKKIERMMQFNHFAKKNLSF